MSEKVLVVGATGMLGRPVAERLAADGFEVAVLTSDRPKAEQMFAGRFRIVDGDVTRPDSLSAPLEGMDFLYINLSAKLDPEKYQRIEIEGTANLASAARKAGIKRVMNISSAASKGEEIGMIYLDAKVQAERALIECGVDYTVMRPSWFFETLPQFVQGGKAAVLGKQPMKIHWLAAADYAAQVSRAFRTEAAANKCFYNLGPTTLTMPEAVKEFCRSEFPRMSVKQIPFWLSKLLALATGDSKLKLAVPFFEYFSGQDEDVDGSEADEILGANTTTVAQWLNERRLNA